MFPLVGIILWQEPRNLNGFWQCHVGEEKQKCQRSSQQHLKKWGLNAFNATELMKWR